MWSHARSCIRLAALYASGRHRYDDYCDRQAPTMKVSAKTRVTNGHGGVHWASRLTPAALAAPIRTTVVAVGGSEPALMMMSGQGSFRSESTLDTEDSSAGAGARDCWIFDGVGGSGCRRVVAPNTGHPKLLSQIPGGGVAAVGWSRAMCGQHRELQLLDCVMDHRPLGGESSPRWVRLPTRGVDEHAGESCRIGKPLLLHCECYADDRMQITGRVAAQRGRYQFTGSRFTASGDFNDE